MTINDALYQAGLEQFLALRPQLVAPLRRLANLAHLVFADTLQTIASKQ